MSKSKIEWTEATWNCVRGCSRISPGCQNCYAERMASRFSGLGRQDRGKCEDGPFAGFAERTSSGPRWTGKVELIPEMIEIPLRRKKPTTYFVNSMSDLFHEKLPDEDVYRVFSVMERCPQHTFQVLTKRAARLPDLMRRIYGSANMGCVLPNVWMGVSVEDQQRADERIPLLLQTPAAVRFLSCEPLLGPVDLKIGRWALLPNWLTLQGCGHLPLLEWVIVGGESGPDARSCDIAWIRSIVAQCKAAGVSCFVKQLGASIHGNPGEFSTAIHDDGDGHRTFRLEDRKGGDPSEWPEDLQVREMPEVKHAG